jgi:hypothetical protein
MYLPFSPSSWAGMTAVILRPRGVLPDRVTFHRSGILVEKPSIACCEWTTTQILPEPGSAPGSSLDGLSDVGEAKKRHHAAAEPSQRSKPSVWRQQKLLLAEQTRVNIIVVEVRLEAESKRSLVFWCLVDPTQPSKRRPPISRAAGRWVPWTR